MSRGRGTDLSRPIPARPPDAAWQKTRFSKGLSGRQARSTQPELILRRFLRSRGIRFRLHSTVAQRLSADIVFPSKRIAVFVDGCFWHGCPQHGKDVFRGPNARLWEAKIERNRRRDARATELAKASGWRVIRLWECEVKKDPVSCARRVLALLRPS